MEFSGINPIGHSFRGSSIEPPDPKNFPLNSVDGDMWLSLYLTFRDTQCKADKLNYALSMKAIQRFFDLYPAKGPAPKNSYLHELWNDLQTTTADDGNVSLCTLAADYKAKGYVETDFRSFSTMVDNTGNPDIRRSMLATFLDDLQQFGPEMGAYIPYPQSLKKLDIGVFQFDFPLKDNLQQFLEHIKTLSSHLATKDMDGCSLFLTDLLNTPLDPKNSKITLAELAKDPTKNVTTLQDLLAANPQLEVELKAEMEAISKLEFPS